MKLQHKKDLAIAIAAILAITAILAIAVILAIAAILAISGHKEKPKLSCATLLEEVVLNYIYSKLRTKYLFELPRHASFVLTKSMFLQFASWKKNAL
jgi:hypothetical protein